MVLRSDSGRAVGSYVAPSSSPPWVAGPDTVSGGAPAAGTALSLLVFGKLPQLMGQLLQLLPRWLRFVFTFALAFALLIVVVPLPFPLIARKSTRGSA